MAMPGCVVVAGKSCMVVLKLILAGYYLQCLLYVENTPGRVSLEEFCFKSLSQVIVRCLLWAELSQVPCQDPENVKIMPTSWYGIYCSNRQRWWRVRFSSAAKDNRNGQHQHQHQLCEWLSVCEKISKSGNYKFCPGMSVEVFSETYASVLRYESKSVRVATELFSCVDSPSCSMWHRLARNASIFEEDTDDVMCQPCKQMRSHLDQHVWVSQAVTPMKKAGRLEPSSRCPLSTLSPDSVNKWRENLMTEWAQDKKTIRKYEHTEITLDDDQSDEMAEIVNVINSRSPDAVSEIFQKAESQGKSGVKEIWRNDVRSDQKEFEKDQSRNRKMLHGEDLAIGPQRSFFVHVVVVARDPQTC